MNAKLPPAVPVPEPILGSPLTRRKFLTGLALGAGVGALAPRFSPLVSARLAPLCFTPSSILSAGDFAFLGYYDVQTNESDTSYAQGLTSRSVGGDLRLLTLQLNGRLDEVSLAGHAYGDIIKTTTNAWNLVPGGLTKHWGIWWDAATNRLWTTSAVDYTTTAYPVSLITQTLNDDGTVSNLHGPVGLQGLNAKRVYGGVQAVPAAFQAQFGTGPYVCGFGGYTSLVAQGGGASMGPTMYAFPDIAGYTPNTEIPSNAFLTLADCEVGGANGYTDWYLRGGKAPSGFDRGVRVNSDVINYFDGNDPRQNPSSKPTSPPTPGNWLSPAPDGLGRWTYGDSYFNTGCWIDGPNKHGFLLIATLCGGVAWYGHSTTNMDRRDFEFHVYDPARYGEAIRGSRPVWNVKPAQMWPATFAGLGSSWLSGGGTPGAIGGATYDPATKQLYLAGFGANTFYTRIYVYSVNA